LKELTSSHLLQVRVARSKILNCKIMNISKMAKSLKFNDKPINKTILKSLSLKKLLEEEEKIFFLS